MVWFNPGTPSQALLALDNGQMQMYLYYLRTVAQLQAAQADPKIGLITAGGSTDPIFVNPVPVNQTKAAGSFNPFEVREAREALNYIIDRGHVAREIFGGAVLTQTALWYSQTPEYGRDPVFFAAEDQKYAYNPDTAPSMMFDALSGVPGVSFTNGQWYHNGALLTVSIVERTEDSRQQIGQYVAAQLRTLGFTVNEMPMTAGPAYAIVYNGPPDTGAWQLYTEGWATTALTAYADSDPNYYFCGGEGSNIWTVYVPDPALADVCHKLLFAQYTSVADRQSLIEKAVDLGLKQSVRVWTVAGATFPYAKNAVMPFSYDLAAGPWSFFTTRSAELRNTDGTPHPGGTLLVGNRVMYQSNWNPWFGFTWLYDALVENAFVDFGVYPDPHTGLYIPVRENFSVTTAGPSATMTLPTSGVYTYNTTSNAWDVVPGGTGGKTAISKVSFDITWGSWHDGTPMNMNDYLYSIANAFRRVQGDIAAHDNAAAQPAAQLFVGSFVGLQVVDATHLDIYLNYWHVDPTYIAATADAFPQLAWDSSEVAMETVLHDWTRINAVTAANDVKEALDMTKGASIGYMDREISTGNLSSGGVGTTVNWIPPGFRSGPFTISSSEATSRWAALSTFRTARGHYFPSNGPYVLWTVDTSGGTVTLQNFASVNGASYVYPADHWANLIVPKVPSVTISPAPQVVPGLPASFNATTAVSGQPYDGVTQTYLVLNPATGAVLFQGSPTHTGAGSWQVALNGTQTGTLAPGAYSLELVTVGLEAAVPVFTTESFVAIPALAYFEALLGTQIGLVNNQINNLQNANTKLTNDLASATSTINGLQGILYAAIAIAVVSLVIAALSVVMLMRRGSRGGGGKAAEPPEAEGPPKGPEEL